jgi:Ca2+-binding EF-hand superfamily protein
LQVSRRSRDKPESILLHPDFDISPKHLEQLFNVLDTNGDGELTYAQLKGVCG